MSPRSSLLDENTPGSPGASTETTSAHGREQRTVWMPWGTGGCIATREQEIAFVDHLGCMSDADGADTAHTRGDVTACLNALRGGLTVGGLLEQCPGLDPARLRSAYADLEQRRGHAERAWTIIVASGSISSLVEHGEAAAALLPAVVGRLATAARNSPVSFAATVLRLAESVDKCRRDAYRVEHALARCSAGSTRGRQLSALLYHPYGDSIATRDQFLPDRVGMLNPTRVAALLGELDVEAPALDGLD